MVWKNWQDQCVVSGYTFYIFIWRGISKKNIFLLSDLFLCSFWFRTFSSLSGSAWRLSSVMGWRWRVQFLDLPKSEGLVYVYEYFLGDHLMAWVTQSKSKTIITRSMCVISLIVFTDNCYQNCILFVCRVWNRCECYWCIILTFIQPKLLQINSVIFTHCFMTYHFTCPISC